MIETACMSVVDAWLENIAFSHSNSKAQPTIIEAN